MHEMSLVSSLIETVNNAATEQGFSSVKRLFLSIGILSCIDKDTLLWCIQQCSAGTLLESAEIITTDETGVAHCNTCHHDFEPETLASPCPRCGKQNQQITQGRDLRITALDVGYNHEIHEHRSMS